MTGLMKGGTLALALALTSCSAQPRARVSEEDGAVRTEIFAAREAVWRAFFTGDSAGLVQLLPEDMTAMREDRAEIIRHAIGFRESGGRLVSVSFTDDELLARGDMVVIWSRYRVETFENGSPRVVTGKAFEVFVRENARWINPHWTLREDGAR